MKKFIFISLFVLLFNNILKAEIIADVKIINNDRISKETILTYGDIKIGNNYNDDDLNDVVKNLYETNFFRNVSVKFEKNILIIEVEENKIIQSVKVEGIKSSRIEKQILENLFSKDKSPFLEDKIMIDRNRIKKSLTTQGYYFSNVDTKIVENDNNTVDLIFVITLGDKSVVSKIEFVGDKKIKDRILRSVIITEESKFWKFLTNNKYLNQELVERDKRLLKSYYLNRGYYDINIESATAKLENDNSFRLTYKIDAGEVYNISETKLNLPIDYDEIYFSDVLKKLKKLEGKKYSFNKISKVVNEIDKISLSRQYDFINADLIETKKNNNELELTINIKESDKFYIGRINIYGNNITYENVIRKKLEIDEGDPYNELLNAKSINNLRASNLFKSVDSKLIEGDETGTKTLEITVEEKPTGEITLGAGAGSEGGTIGFSVSENNFLGKGIRLSSSLRLTEDSVKGLFTVINPDFNYSGKSLSTTVESSVIDKLTDNGYKSNKTGFSIGTGFEQYENVRFSPRISNYYEDLSTNSSASANLKKQAGSYTESKFSYGIDYDLRNQRFQTTEGFRSRFNQSIPIYSDDYALMNTYDFKTWYKLPNEMITSFNVFGKMINSLNDEDVRISNRFYLPRNKLKGFKTRNMGPKDGKDYIGGNYATAINFDTTLPMIFSTVDNIDMKYFFDAANLWGVDYSNTVDDSDKIRSSTGVAVDWWTPIGPLNFSLAHDLSKASTDKTETFQFSLGTTF